MDTHSAEIVEGLLKWWDARYGIVIGSRNANLYKLAAAFNNFGIIHSDALAVCFQFVDLNGPDPFTASEITHIVNSAYRHTKHGIRQWGSRNAPSKRSIAPWEPRILSESQARILEDRLVELLQRQWPTLCVLEAPTAPPTPANTALDPWT